MQKLLITIYRDYVAPRFDMSSEVLVISYDNGVELDRKNLVLPAASADELSQLIISEGVSTVICGGIENEYYQYLNWKKVIVIDSVIGRYEDALSLALKNKLTEGKIIPEQVSGESATP